MKQITNINEAIQQIGVENTQMDYGSTVVNESKLYHKAFTHEGVKCLIIRMTAGHLCGYIETKQDFDENDYDAADELFSVLWGITYVGDGWIGFDCAHSGQMSPLQRLGSDGRYFTLEEVVAMTKGLAEQESKLRGANMLDIKKVKQMLENGEEVRLECVDEEEYLDLEENWRDSRQIILDSSLIVTGLYGFNKNNLELEGANRVIPSSHFKYFRIVEAKPTFDDLIDSAVKAQKYGLIHKVEMIGRRSLYLSEKPTSKALHYCLTSIEDGISFINSLYTETFVIENFQDTKKLKSGAKALLSNGEEVVFSNRTGVDDSLWFEYNGCHSAIIPYIALKGATVTQKRGK